MSYDNAEPGDQAAEIHYARHSDYRDMDCSLCDEAATEYRSCSDCGSIWEDGEWRGEHKNDCDHATLLDYWMHELVCPVRSAARPAVTGAAEAVHYGPCGDPVTDPNHEACEFHQRVLDAVSVGKVYQRMVATR